MKKLTAAMKKMGITFISNLQNTNGSWTCKVDVRKIMVQSEEGNYRKFSENHADDIRADFDKRSVRNPILFVHQNTLKTVDGRHTTMVWKWFGTRIITADIHFNITPEQAAKIFYDLATNTKRMNTWATVQAATAAAIPAAIAIQKHLVKYKLTIPHEGNQRTPDIRSYSPLEEAYENGPEFLDKFFCVLSSVYRSTGLGLHQPSGGCGFLRGLVSFLRDKADVPVQEICDKLKSNQAGYEAAKIAAGLANSEGYGRPDRSHFKRSFESVYARGSRRLAA